jgi:ornithine carbamoyltransferase
MSYTLANRSLLSLDGFTAGEVNFLLEMASDLKQGKAKGTELQQLRGKNIAVLFEKAGTRTRDDFEVAALDQGAHVSFVGPGNSRLGEMESVKDTARVLGRLYDAMECRGFEPGTVQALAQWSGVPVFSGLTLPFHPTQVLADYLTMQEHCNKPLAQMRLAYLGDARHNMGDSMLQGAALMGLDFRIGAPRGLWPAQALIDAAQSQARRSGALLNFTETPEDAVRGVDFIYTPVLATLAEPERLWSERIPQLRPHPANSDELLPLPASLAKQQAANRLHTIKALLVATLA